MTKPDATSPEESGTRLLVVDDDQAWLGGLNIGGEYAGSWIVGSPQEDSPWRDNAISLRGPSARLLVHPLVKTWRYIQNGGHIGQTEYLHNVHQGEFGVVASTPTRRSPLQMLRILLAKAHSSILLTMAYFAPPDELIDDLCGAARRRVRVRLMLPGRGDVQVLLTAARSFYEKLLLAGVEVYERQGAVLHAKSLCVDGETSVIGSTNLDERSIELNCELSVIIRNREFARQMHNLFDHDILYAHRITLRQWRRRPILDRLMQWAVMRARYLL